MINKDLEEIEDIPKIDHSMIPLKLETIEYIDLKRSTSYKFIKDSSLIEEIYIEDNGEEIKVENLQVVSIFNEIAAETPILIN